MERTFLIGEYGKGEWYISESELKKRCEIVASILSGHSPGIRTWNEARDILVNGEENMLSVEEANKMVQQPDPWEEWIEKMPKRIESQYKCESSKLVDYEKSWNEWERDMKQWYRQMPRR